MTTKEFSKQLEGVRGILPGYQLSFRLQLNGTPDLCLVNTRLPETKPTSSDKAHTKPSASNTRAGLWTFPSADDIVKNIFLTNKRNTLILMKEINTSMVTQSKNNKLVSKKLGL